MSPEFVISMAENGVWTVLIVAGPLLIVDFIKSKS